MKGDKGRKVNLSTKKTVPIQAGRQMKGNKGVPDILGDKGRQMNPSTQRAAPGIQAGRPRETNEGRQRETNEPVHPESCARHPGWETMGEIKGDKGRQMNPSTQRAVPGIQAGRERETNEGDKGRHMNPSTQRAVPDPGWETTGDK